MSEDRERAQKAIRDVLYARVANIGEDQAERLAADLTDALISKVDEFAVKFTVCVGRLVIFFRAELFG